MKTITKRGSNGKTYSFEFWMSLADIDEDMDIDLNDLDDPADIIDCWCELREDSTYVCALETTDGGWHEGFCKTKNQVEAAVTAEDALLVFGETIESIAEILSSRSEPALEAEEERQMATIN